MMPLMRKPQKRKRFDNDEEYQMVIPTPSIDQVLQNLASNALASTSNDNELDQGNSNSGKNKTYVKKLKHKQHTEKKSSDVGIKVKGNRESSPPRRTSARIEALKSSSIETVQKSNANNNNMGIGINAKNHAYTNGDDNRINNRTVSEMLNDLIKKSVNNHKAKAASTSKEQQRPGQIIETAKNRLRQSNQEVLTYQPKSRTTVLDWMSAGGVGNNNLIGSYHPRPFSSSLYGYGNSVLNHLNQAGPVDPRVESTVDQVVHSLRADAGNYPVVNVVHRMPTTSATAATSSQPPSSALQQQMQHIIVHQLPNTNNDAGIMPTTTSQANIQGPQQQTSITLDDDVQILEDDEEGVEEATPFCKNCASEIPLAIKRLDNLDKMVDRLVSMVKKKLNSIPSVNTATEINPTGNATTNLTTSGSLSTKQNPITNDQLGRLQIELQIMSQSPKEFNFETLYNSNAAILGDLTFNQLNSALESLVHKKYLIKFTHIVPAIYVKNSTMNGVKLLQKELETMLYRRK